jgi:hypothetical protein
MQAAIPVAHYIHGQQRRVGRSRIADGHYVSVAVHLD